MTSTAPPRVGPDASLEHLIGRLEHCERRVRRAVARRRAGDPHPDDPFRGLYLADEHVDWVLASTPALRSLPPDPEEAAELAARESAASRAEVEGEVVRLRRMADAFGLSGLDVELLVLALAPDVDSRFERLYGYLNDDVTKRRATVRLALELGGASPLDAAARALLMPGGALVVGHLVRVDDGDQPFLSRSLRVPDRVTAYLLGDDARDPVLVGLLSDPPPPVADGSALARALDAGARLAYLMEQPGGAALSMAVDGLRRRGAGALVLDLDWLGRHEDPLALVAAAGRECRLAGSGLVAGPVDGLARDAPGALRALTRVSVPLVLIGRTTWDPSWADSVPAIAHAVAPTSAARAELWRTELGGDGPDAGEVEQFRLAPESVGRSVRAARWQAAMEGAELGPAHLLAGARSQNAAGLERLARRLVPSVGWDDLVVRPTVRGQLMDLAGRARNRDRVLGEWAMRPGGGRGRGVTALFAGDPGTGKTMAAEVVAHVLGLDLYAVDLATVVDKYIGETEKNLERIFGQAERVNGVILFDEADALFGRRSEVSDAHDRHANVEVAYLLQRMESFDGLAVLATNLRTNLDEAFARRLDAIVEFPMPDAGERRSLWDRCLGPALPRGDDVDLDFCARSFELSGGSIRSVAVSAAFLSADAGRPVVMADVVRSIEREYRKLGRLVLESEFGPWFAATKA